MAKDTKSKLLEAALEMFSQNGCAGTNYEERFGSSKNMPAIPENMNELKELTLRMPSFSVENRFTCLRIKLRRKEIIKRNRDYLSWMAYDGYGKRL